MKHVDASKVKSGFRVVLESATVQGAVMVLEPGEPTSEKPENEHPKAEQWVYVAAGTGVARVKGRSVKVKAGSMVLIEKGEAHQIVNTGREKLVTINFYAPPAYTKEGEVKRSVKRR